MNKTHIIAAVVGGFLFMTVFMGANAFSPWSSSAEDDLREVCKDRYGPDAEAIALLTVDPPHAVCQVDGEPKLADMVERDYP